MNMNTSNQRSNQNLKAAVLVAILALLGANVYQFVNNRSLQKDNMTKETEIVELDKAKAELEKQYQESVAELNTMKTDNEELNRSIEVQKEEIRLQKDKISLLLVDSKNLRKAKDEMANMKNKLNEYVTEINRLKNENQELSTSNVQLSADKEQLSKDVQTKEQEKRELENIKSTLISEKENISSEKEALSARVNKAGAINLQKIQVDGFQSRDGKKPREKSNASEIDFIQVCFKTTKNANADSGTETFYIRIINPIGETQTIESSGSGVIKNLATKETVKYSTIANVQYNNNEQEGCGKFSNPGGFQKGVYQVEVYNKGYKVGVGSLKLK
ncbi:MAG: hypothetical protein IPO62_09495 [Saprospiraceae bacterium]|nr:hypothetical protein [Saprospiraceae bacterium]MBK9631283.1 hypothetical protein [Saprospiraceae bacterium]